MLATGKSSVETAVEPSLAWYALYTKHRHEKSAKLVLEGKGFEVLLPLFHSMRRWKDRRQVVELPIFPGYLFLRASLEHKLNVLRTPGVFWFVETRGKPAVVPEADIDLISRINERPELVEPHAYLRNGDFVRIHSGPLCGVEGILTRARNRYRVVLSVDLLKKSAAVEVELSAVEPVNRPKDRMPPVQPA